MAKPIDLLAPFRDLQKAEAQSRRRSSMAGVEVQIRGKLELDLDAAKRISTTLAAEMVAEAKGEIASGALGSVDEQTLERRQRTIRTQDGRFRSRTLRDQERYPGGYQPNPASRTYGKDSGLLYDSIKASVEKRGDAAVIVPKSRQRAGFMRRILVLDPRTQEYRTVFERVIDGSIEEVVRTGKGRLPGVRKPRRR